MEIAAVSACPVPQKNAVLSFLRLRISFASPGGLKQASRWVTWGIIGLSKAKEPVIGRRALCDSGVSELTICRFI